MNLKGSYLLAFDPTCYSNGVFAAILGALSPPTSIWRLVLIRLYEQSLIRISAYLDAQTKSYFDAKVHKREQDGRPR